MKKILKRIIGLILVLVIVLALAFGIYVSDYYHATNTAHNIMTLDQKRAAKDHQVLVFKPNGNIKAGLIFYPGGKVDYQAYAPLLTKLANKGILCLCPHMPFNLAVFASNKAEGLQKQYPEVTKWYIGGHSLGGVMASQYAYKHQNDFQGMIFLASYPTHSFQNTSLKSLSIYGSQDHILNKKNYTKNKKNFPRQTKEVIIQGGNHGQFANYGQQSGDGKASITALKQQEETVETIMQWMENEAG